MMLHNYKSREFHRTSNGENQLSSFRDICSGPWASPCGSNKQVTITVHNYRSRKFPRTSNSVNPSSGFKVTVSTNGDRSGTRFDKFWLAGKPIWGKWANDHDLAQLQVQKIPLNLNGVNPSSCFSYMNCVCPVGKSIWVKLANAHDTTQLHPCEKGMGLFFRHTIDHFFFL